MASAATLPQPESVAPPAPESVAPPPLPPLGLQEQAEQPSEPCSGSEHQAPASKAEEVLWAWKTARSPTQNAEADGRKARTPWIWKKNGPLLVITLNKYRTVSRARQADGFRSAANLSVDELKDSTFSACVTKVYGLASVFSELKHKLSGTGDVPHEGNKGAAEVRAKIQKTARLQTYSNHHEMTFFVYPSQRSLTQCCAPLVSDCVGHPTTHASHSLSVCSANPAPHFALFDL